MAALAPILTACGSGAATSSGSAAPLETLRIGYPPMLAFAAPLLLIDQDGALPQHASSIDIGESPSVDVLASMLINNEAELVAVPTHVGAQLANHGHEVSLAAVTVWGNLWLIGPESAAGWQSLRGQKVGIPLPNDVPDLVFQFLADAKGLGKYDYQVEHLSEPTDAVARLENGDTKWAVLPEHVATLALNEANQKGRRLKRVLNLQEEWAGVTGGQPSFPEAGIMVPTALAAQRPQLVAALLDDLARTVETVKAANPQAAATIATGMELPEPLVADVIPRLNLQVKPATEARSELEAFYNSLAKLSPDIIGGKLPDASFYLDDPR